MNNAKLVILPVVAVAAICMFCKAQAGPVVTDQPASAATSPVVTQPAPQVPIDDLPYWNTTRQCARMLNAGLDAIGKQDKEPRKMHFEFTITLPPKE
jgi:hypothetical protein